MGRIFEEREEGTGGCCLQDFDFNSGTRQAAEKVDQGHEKPLGRGGHVIRKGL